MPPHPPNCKNAVRSLVVFATDQQLAEIVEECFAPSSHSNLQHWRLLRYLLQTPIARTKAYGERSFSVAAPKLWNNLPDTIKNIDSLDS